MTEQPASRIMPVVLGIAFTAILLIAVAILAQKRRDQQSAIPELSIIAPPSESATDSPLVVRFSSSAPIGLSATGWGARGMHLHAWVNDMQYMPAAADITRDEGGNYSWVIKEVRRGDIAVRLGWADASHRSISAGTSQTISSVLR